VISLYISIISLKGYPKIYEFEGSHSNMDVAGNRIKFSQYFGPDWVHPWVEEKSDQIEDP
tara:strand:- start:27 stop:206 length:180 start_codon:yes stop_codon:yes gene_type:complete